MLVPFMIFLMILSPVLIPAAVTARERHARGTTDRPVAADPALAASLSQPPPDVRPLQSGRTSQGCGPTGLWGIRLQNRGAVPVTGEQRQFDVEPVAADFPAAPRRRRDPLDTSPS